jgi:hypothetical protein
MVVAMDDVDRQVLELAGRDYRRPGSLDRAARAELDLSPIAYWQRLNRLLGDPDALAAAPMLVRRLQRRRDAATAQRRAS